MVKCSYFRVCNIYMICLKDFGSITPINGPFTFRCKQHLIIIFCPFGGTGPIQIAYYVPFVISYMYWLFWLFWGSCFKMAYFGRPF